MWGNLVKAHLANKKRTELLVKEQLDTLHKQQMTAIPKDSQQHIFNTQCSREVFDRLEEDRVQMCFLFQQKKKQQIICRYMEHLRMTERGIPSSPSTLPARQPLCLWALYPRSPEGALQG
eukprot:90640-Pelagomonas_calceolata.AAC.1